MEEKPGVGLSPGEHRASRGTVMLGAMGQFSLTVHLIVFSFIHSVS